MNEKFFDLKKEKQDRMINAALKIFALNGYQHASTDDIVAEAAISKGLLFHYFINKLGLYTFLYDYSVRFMALEMSASTTGNETDFFTLYLKLENSKIQVLKNYPYMQLFLDSISKETVKEALLATEEKRDRLENIRTQAFAATDKTLFRPEADPFKIQSILDHTIRGITESHFRNNSFQPDILYQEIKTYIDMLRKLTYK